MHMPASGLTKMNINKIYTGYRYVERDGLLVFLTSLGIMNDLQKEKIIDLVAQVVDRAYDSGYTSGSIDGTEETTRYFHEMLSREE